MITHSERKLIAPVEVANGHLSRPRLARKSLITLGMISVLGISLLQSGCVGLTAKSTGETGTTSPAASAATAPAISTQPASQTVASGQSATFFVVATGSGTLTYQWAKSGSPIPGATSVSYSTPSETTSDSGAQFAVTISNSAGNATSNVAVLTVNAAPVAPSINSQPASQSISSGQTATFFVSASGTPTLNYQWAKNGSPIPGATGANYTTPAETTSDSGAQFAVTVSNSAGNVTSSAAVLNVSAAIVAPAITAQPSSQTITSGQTATFFVAASGTQLSYQWAKNGGAIGGATSASYTTPSETTSDNGAQFTVSVSNSAGSATSSAAVLNVSAAIVAPAITAQPSSQTITSGQTATFFVAASGTQLNYQWAKNGGAIGGATSASYTTPSETTSDSGAQFTVTVSNSAGTITSSGATLTVNAAPVAPSITVQPSSQTAISGQSATFSVTASGSGPLTYQWRQNGTNIVGANSPSYTTPATTSANNGTAYSVVVSNTAGTATSNTAMLTINTTQTYTMSAKTPSLSFAGTVGGSAPASQTERIIDTGPNNTCTPFTASVTQAWLSVNPASSCAAGDLTVSVSISGLAAGTYSGALVITSALETNSPLSVPITLTMTAAGTSTLTTSLSTLNFNSVNIGSNSSQSVTLTNSGTASITVSSVSLNAAAGFTTSGVSSGLIIPAGQTATLSVSFAPATAATVNGTLTITSNASNPSVTINVNGAGVQPTSSTVVLNWNASSSTVSGYDVFRSTSSGQNYVQLNGAPVSGTQFTDTGVQSGTTYYYVVTAVNSNGQQSSDSNQATVTTP